MSDRGERHADGQEKPRSRVTQPNVRDSHYLGRKHVHGRPTGQRIEVFISCISCSARPEPVRSPRAAPQLEFAGKKSGSPVGPLHEPRSLFEARRFNLISVRKPLQGMKFRDHATRRSRVIPHSSSARASRFRPAGPARPRRRPCSRQQSWAGSTCARQAEEQRRNAGLRAPGRAAIPITPLQESSPFVCGQLQRHPQVHRPTPSPSMLFFDATSSSGLPACPGRAGQCIACAQSTCP